MAEQAVEATVSKDLSMVAGIDPVVVPSATGKMIMRHASNEQIAYHRQENDEGGRHSADLGVLGVSRDLKLLFSRDDGVASEVVCPQPR